VLRGAETKDIRSQTLDGREIELNVSAAPLRDREGHPTGAVCIFRDQTERKRLEREHEETRVEAIRQAAQLDRIFEGITDGLIVYDGEGHEVRTNAAARQLLGLDAAQPGHAQLSVPERATLYEARDEQGHRLAPEDWSLIRVLRGQMPIAGGRDIWLHTLGGRDLYLHTSAAPLRDQDGHMIGAVTILRDLTERKRTESALRASEARYRAVVETQTELISHFLPDTTLTFVNEVSCRSMGKSREELIGTKVLDLVPDAAREQVGAVIDGLLAHPGTATVEHEIRVADGSLRWQQWVNRTILDEQGQVVEIQGIGRDITERKWMEQDREQARRESEAARVVAEAARAEAEAARAEAEAARAEAEAARAEAERQADRLHLLIEGMSDGVLVYDTAGTLARTNAAARHLVGLDAAPPGYSQLPVLERLAYYQLHDAQGRPLAPQDLPQARVLRGEALTGTHAMEIRVRTLDGRELDLIISGGGLRNPAGHLVGAVAILHDQTEHKRAEEARIRAQAAVDANQRMEQFLATASHDLRTPLTAALGRVQLAQMHLQQWESTTVAGSVSTTLEYNLMHAEQAVRRLSRLVDRLFDLAQLQAGQQLDLQLATLDLATLVRDAVAAQRVASPLRRIRLRLPVDQSVPVVADADRLGQVITNYLSNALKYSPNDRPVTVQLRMATTTTTVAVRDAGPGIPADEQARVWDLHHRVPGVEVQEGMGRGLGLGLHISRAIIEQHGGRVGVHSLVGKGSTFWFTLPLVPPAASTLGAIVDDPMQL
jgi:PAS domain S-box-containing protein